MRSLLYTVEMMGGLQVRCETGSTYHPKAVLTRFKTQKTAGLLAFLASRRDRCHSREVLTEMFWPHAPSAQAAARRSLSVSISVLRTLLEPVGIPSGSVLLTDRASVGLSPTTVTTDIEQFDALLDVFDKAGRGHGETKEETERCGQLIEQAAKLFRTPILPGHYEVWITPEQERLTDRWLYALLRQAERYEKQDQNGLALSLIRRASSLNPDAEEVLSALERLGHVPEPFVPPSSAPVKKARPVRPRASQYSQSDDLKINEVVTETNAEARIASGTLLSPSRPALAFALNRFFGREEEIHQILDWMDDPTTRLINLLGPGGSGKTRLAREALRLLSRDEEAGDHTGAPVGFRAQPYVVVDLIAISRPQDIPGLIAGGIGIADHSLA